MEKGIDKQNNEAPTRVQKEVWHKRVYGIFARYDLAFFASVALLGQLAGSIPDFFPKANSWILAFSFVVVIIGVVINGMLIFEEIKRSARSQVEENDFEKLKKRNEELEAEVSKIPSHIYDVTSMALKNLSSDFGLTKADRISIFGISNNGFFLKGRYAGKPEFHYKSDRMYAIDEGVLAKTLKAGKFYAQSLPDPKNSLEEYIGYSSENYNMKAEEVKALRMKSRNFYARAMLDQTGMKTVAILVIESESTKSLKEASLDMMYSQLETKIQLLNHDIALGINIDPALAKAAEDRMSQ